MIFKNKRGNVLTEELPKIILVLVILVVLLAVVAIIIKNNRHVTDQPKNLCDQAGGECLSQCDGSRVKLTGDFSCPTQGQVCCTKPLAGVTG